MAAKKKTKKNVKTRWVVIESNTRSWCYVEQSVLVSVTTNSAENAQDVRDLDVVTSAPLCDVIAKYETQIKNLRAELARLTKKK